MDWGVVEGRREKRLQRASVRAEGLVAGFKRAPHMGCMMSSVEGLRENRTEEGTPYAVGVHVDWGGQKVGKMHAPHSSSTL